MFSEILHSHIAIAAASSHINGMFDTWTGGSEGRGCKKGAAQLRFKQNNMQNVKKLNQGCGTVGGAEF